MNRFFENLLISIIRSKSIFSKFAEKLVPSNYLYPKHTFRETNINGIKLILDISDYVNHLVYFNLEDKGHEQLLELASKCNLVFDVGANIGFTAINMAKVINGGGEVHAFEPDPYNFKRLQENVDLNPSIPIVLQNYGFGQEDGKLKLTVVTPDNRGGNRLVCVPGKDYSLVDITTIDLYCDEHQIQSIDLIKIDVEGFEYNVLRGATKLIAHSKPHLFIEIDDNNLGLQNSSAKELVLFLELYYNKIYHAETLTPINSKKDFSNCHFDLVASYEN
jgi:FkbM family methyltransferase